MARELVGSIILVVVGGISTASATPADASTAVRAAPCTGAQLSVRPDPSFEGDSAMGGQRGDQFVIENISHSACTIRGKPGVALFDRRGRRMGRALRPTSRGEITLAPGGKTTVEFGYHSCEFVASASGRNPKRCRISRRVQFRFYGIRKVFTVPEKIDANDGVEQVFELPQQ